MQPTAVAWCVRVIRRSSCGVCGSFDDRRPSSLHTTIVVPTKIAWSVPSLRVQLILAATAKNHMPLGIKFSLVHFALVKFTKHQFACIINNFFFKCI